MSEALAQAIPDHAAPYTAYDLLDLDDGCYRLTRRLPADSTGRITDPFPVEFDPASLVG